MAIKRFLVGTRPLIAALILGLLLSFALANGSFAACTNDPEAAQKSARFLDNTTSLLNGSNGPRTPAEISADVRDFVAANPQALGAVIALLKAGGLTPEQQKAIGTGLGLAAGVCLRPDPTFAAEIQTQIAGTDSTDAKNAYAAITGNQLIGSVGGGGGSSGAAGGSTNPITTSGSGFGGFEPFASNSVSNNPGNFFGGSAGGTGGANITNTSTTTNTVTSTVVCTVSKTC